MSVAPNIHNLTALISNELINLGPVHSAELYQAIISRADAVNTLSRHEFNLALLSLFDEGLAGVGWDGLIRPSTEVNEKQERDHE